MAVLMHTKTWLLSFSAEFCLRQWHLSSVFLKEKNISQVEGLLSYFS